MHFLNHLTVLSFAVAAIAAPQDEDDSAPSSSMAEDSPSSVMSGDMEPSSTDTSEEDPCLAACKFLHSYQTCSLPFLNQY